MSVQTHSIDPPIYGRYVRIIPRGWRSHISMRLELYGGPWSKWYSSSFLKWKINEFTLKVRNDITVGPLLTATSLRRPFFGGEGGGGSPCIHSSFNLSTTATSLRRPFFLGGGGGGGQSMYSLFFQPLYNGHLSTTAFFFGGGGGGGQSMYSLFFQPLYNGHFLLSPRWPLYRGATVCIGGLIFVCS